MESLNFLDRKISRKKKRLTEKRKGEIEDLVSMYVPDVLIEGSTEDRVRGRRGGGRRRLIRHGRHALLLRGTLATSQASLPFFSHNAFRVPKTQLQNVIGRHAHLMTHGD